ncbi:MAG: heavy metal-binding domain-containing protein [Pseudomonadota bacterium]
MKRLVVVLIVGFIIGLGLNGCGDSQEPDKGTQQQAASQAASGEKKAAKEGIGMTKARTIIQPGWQCPGHENIKSAYPGNCPIDKMQMKRIGEWTCADHPNISSTEGGPCPICNKDLVKVADLEKQTGKSIADLTKEYQAAEKGKK